MQKEHIIRCTSFSTAYDICSILDSFKTIVFSVTSSWVPDKFGPGYIEYEIRYSYVVEGDE